MHRSLGDLLESDSDLSSIASTKIFPCLDVQSVNNLCFVSKQTLVNAQPELSKPVRKLKCAQQHLFSAAQALQKITLLSSQHDSDFNHLANRTTDLATKITSTADIYTMLADEVTPPIYEAKEDTIIDLKDQADNTPRPSYCNARSCISILSLLGCAVTAIIGEAMVTEPKLSTEGKAIIGTLMFGMSAVCLGILFCSAIKTAQQCFATYRANKILDNACNALSRNSIMSAPQSSTPLLPVDNNPERKAQSYSV